MKLIITKEEFLKNIENNEWYIDSLRSGKIDYWNFNYMLINRGKHIPCIAIRSVDESYFSEKIILEREKGFTLLSF